MVVSQWAHAHDLYVAIDFDGKIRLNAEDDVQPCGILWVELQAVDPAYFGSSCVPHRRAGLEPTREREHQGSGDNTGQQAAPGKLQKGENSRGAVGHAYYSSDRWEPRHAGLIGKKFPKTVSQPVTRGEALFDAMAQVKPLVRVAKGYFRP